MLDSQTASPAVSSPGVDIVIGCCRDEVDIIALFIDFYLAQAFDRICLIDNGSVDGTLDQIIHHPAQDRITLLRDSRPGYDIRLIEYYRMFAIPGTRWVFFLDVDEFVSLPGGSIKEYARELPPEVTLLKLPTAEMQPVPNVIGEMTPLLSTQREARFPKDGVELATLECKVVWKAGDVRKIYCGKHDVVIEPRIAHLDERVYIRHFHTRSAAQFRSKLRNRLQTEAAMASMADPLTLFDSETRRKWIEESRRLLEADGWLIESERAAAMDTVYDGAVADWYRAHQPVERHLVVSPVIPLNDESDGWFCFCMRSFRTAEGHTNSEHLVLFYSADWRAGTLDQPVFAPGNTVPVRLHSECVLGDIFSTARCDCGYQLGSAMAEIKKAGGGVLVYLRQEGRGVGLFDKLRSLAIDHEDTFHRNEVIGLPGDARGYGMAAEVLRRLGVSKARLMSGNMAKAAALRSAGIDTVMDNRLSLDCIAPEALREIRAKLRKGYAYELIEPLTVWATGRAPNTTRAAHEE
jgi:GTP cyclohydrolase II